MDTRSDTSRKTTSGAVTGFDTTHIVSDDLHAEPTPAGGGGGEGGRERERERGGVKTAGVGSRSQVCLQITGHGQFRVGTQGLIAHYVSGVRIPVVEIDGSTADERQEVTVTWCDPVSDRWTNMPGSGGRLGNFHIMTVKSHPAVNAT